MGAALYYEFVSDSESTQEKIEACEKAGMSFDDFLKISNIHAKADSMAGAKTKAKAADFLRRLVDAGYSTEQVSAAGEAFKFQTGMAYTGVMEDYTDMTGAGLDADKATMALTALSRVEPLPGNETVLEYQKLNAISRTGLTEEEQRLAAKAVVSESTYKKLNAAGALDVTVSDYGAFRETLPYFDANGNNSYSQDEVTAALMSMDLTENKKAVLWQLANTSWKHYRNPFNSAVGAQVKAQLEASTAVSSGGASQPYSNTALGMLMAEKTSGTSSSGGGVGYETTSGTAKSQYSNSALGKLLAGQNVGVK